MDELLAAMLKAQLSLEEFDGLLYSSCKSLQGEIDMMRKDLIPVSEVNKLTQDIVALETFHSVSASQLREYLQDKINLLKAYLNEE